MAIEFLTLQDVLTFHAAGLKRWGGMAGIRDRSALEAAVAQPQASFDGEYLHADLFAMAAAYGFHIAESQGFLDGNKRAAVLAMVVFLDMNGVRVPEVDDRIYRTMLDIADHSATKADLAEVLRALAAALQT